MAYSRESAILRDQAGETVLGLIEKHGAFIAGGAVTSIFSSEKINDFDIFFQSQESLDRAIGELANEDKELLTTESAVSLFVDGHRVQLVKAITGTPWQVLEKFDFTICQAAWDGKQFYFAPDFMQHLSQRRIVYNINSEYPICSLYRARKFIKRGFHFSGIDAIKLGLRIQSLQINDCGELRRQLMGIDTLFLKELTDSLKGKEQKKYEFNDFLATLEPYLEKLDRIIGSEE